MLNVSMFDALNGILSESGHPARGHALVPRPAGPPQLWPASGGGGRGDVQAALVTEFVKALHTLRVDRPPILSALLSAAFRPPGTALREQEPATPASPASRPPRYGRRPRSGTRTSYWPARSTPECSPRMSTSTRSWPGGQRGVSRADDIIGTHRLRRTGLQDACQNRKLPFAAD
jgi:hypothetical protein